ncbi:MAG: efflux RND transporter periplasmic adaptor subunit [Acidobacteria bacterium]|nr:MAG: efflux RND transporter periplasmic adaptor subunit [Acidobacteriota bacterium]
MKLQVIRTPLTRLAALALAGLGMAGCQEAPQMAPPPPPEVTVAKSQVRDIHTVYEFTGNTEATASVVIQARVQGYLDEMHFEPASFVKAGQLLFVIEPEPFIARKNRAEANVRSSEAALRRAESDLERLELAVQTNAVSQQEVTRARAERDQADAAQLGARADLENARIELEYTRVKSPVDGMVSRNLIDLGNMVGTLGAQNLASVRKLDPIYAYFEVNERLFARMMEQSGGHAGDNPERPRKPATLIIRETGHTVDGVIDSVDNTVDTGTGTIMLRGIFPNPDARVFPGFFVNITIEGELLEDAVIVEEKAVGTDLSGKYLYVVGDGNIVEQRAVELGQPQDDGTIPVLSGLEAGETYILEGLLKARPGMPVTPSTGSGGE